MIGAIKAGEAFIALVLKDQTAKGFQNFRAKMKTFAAGFAVFSGAVIGTGAAIGGTIASFIPEVTELGGSLVDMSARTGVAVETLSALKLATEQAGSSLDDLETALRTSQKMISLAAGGNQAAADSLGMLGLTAAELMRLSPEDQFFKIADAISRILNQADKSAAAMRIFGRSGTMLLPILADGEQGLRDLMRAAEEAGLVLSTKTALEMDALGDSVDHLSAQWLRLKVNIVDTADLADDVGVLANAMAWLNKTTQKAGDSLDKALVGRPVLAAAVESIKRSLDPLYFLKQVIPDVSTPLGGPYKPISSAHMPVDLVEGIRAATHPSFSVGAFSSYATRGLSQQGGMQWVNKVEQLMKRQLDVQKDMLNELQDVDVFEVN